MFLAAVEEIMDIDCGGSGKELLRNLVATAVESLVDRIYSINQYLQVSEGQKEELSRIYHRTWQALRETQDIENVLRRQHYPQIRDWVTRIYPPSLREDLKSASRVGQVPCQEYSADFQMALYGINPRSIVPPVLDLGCGSHALLVRRLRHSGVEAFGVDRQLLIHEPYLTQGDWFRDADGKVRWGTIVSNMAFSNHFCFVDRYDPGQVAAYKQRFHRLLDSLVPGGTFHYGPSVPELESTVDCKLFAVQTARVRDDFQTTRIVRVAPCREG